MKEINLGVGCLMHLARERRSERGIEGYLSRTDFAMDSSDLRGEGDLTPERHVTSLGKNEVIEQSVEAKSGGGSGLTLPD